MILNSFLLPRKSEKMNVKIYKLLPVYKDTLCKIAIGGYRAGCIGKKTWEKAWLCENLTFLFSIRLALRCWSIRSISYFTGNITPHIVVHCSHTILKSWSVRDFGWWRPWTEAHLRTSVLRLHKSQLFYSCNYRSKENFPGSPYKFLLLWKANCFGL